jgi:hypothetical protein
MGLSRLQNFLKNAKGNILYVNPNDLDATDSIENQGNSLTRPFKTIQRALIEAARFSYQPGLDNDRFGKTTVLVYPGEHIVDNRPGLIPYDDGTGIAKYRDRNGTSGLILSPFNLTSNFDLTTADNDLYKLNSIHGGVIIPRGTSLVGLDLRKTQIRPKYVPNPSNPAIQRSSIFRVTGACYFFQFSILDADPNSTVYKDYTSNIFVPNFSHHKLACFEYADGVNNVTIDDGFLNIAEQRTDLQMYYEKISDVFDDATGRPIQPDYPAGNIDIQPKIDEYRIVGSKGDSVGISSIKAGDGVTATTLITVQTNTSIRDIGLDVDTPIRINGISASGYNGNFVCAGVTSTTEFTYRVSNAPTNALENPANATVNIVVDTVTSASPYIFNVSLRSVFGMCGMLADGNKATGFKSMVVAQFTGIGLQKDDNAFVKYNEVTGSYDDSTTIPNLSSDSRAIYKPDYSNFHIKCTNDSFIQVVSVFAIGFAEHFVTESGGDQSVTNSNSNFGAKSLLARGFKGDAFAKDDIGYITHVIPPRELQTTETSVEFSSVDVYQTAVGVGSTGRLYLYNQNNSDQKPQNVIEGYRFGAKVNDELKVQLNVGGNAIEYAARITMPINGITTTQYTSKKIAYVGRVVGFNSISSNVLTLTSNHNFINGESIRIISDNGSLPDGLRNNRVYYAITKENANVTFSGNDQIQIAPSLNAALAAESIGINSLGGVLSIESRVSDKNSGDIGHPVQFDSTNSQWYVNVSTSSTDNRFFSQVVGLGTSVLGDATPRTYITRKQDDRALLDTVYRARYVIPSGSGITSARPPVDGYVIQESNDTGALNNNEVSYLYATSGKTLSNISEIRNPSFISTCSYSSPFAYVDTEKPHGLTVGSNVSIVNVISSTNPTGTAGTGYNRDYTVIGVSSAKSFIVGLNTNPGVFSNSTSLRTTALPRFKRVKANQTFSIYRSTEVNRYIAGQQDGVYHVLLAKNSISPTATPFTNEKFSQNIQYFYPQTNRDNPVSDPKTARSFALPTPIGEVSINDPQNSLTKETQIGKVIEFGGNIGLGITNIQSNSAGTAHTIFTKIDHGLNRIVSVSIASSGTNYGVGSGITETYYNTHLVGFAGSVVGKHATARVTIHPAGGITDIKIIDGGSAYAIGNTMTITNLPQLSGSSNAVIRVEKIYNAVGESIDIQGITSATYESHNTLYKVSGITNGQDREIRVTSSTIVGSANTIGIGSEATLDATIQLAGPVINISGFSYDTGSGIATFSTVQKHGLYADNKIRIANASSSFYNGDFIVRNVLGITSFTSFVGVGITVPATGTAEIYSYGTSSQGGIITNDDENVSGRMSATYAGITSTLSAQIVNSTVTDIYIQNVENLDFNIGDFLQIDEELMRIRSTTSTSSVDGSSGYTSNPISVFRGILGTKASSHDLDSVVKKVKCLPIEIRRNSIIRASGHTFEYLGYGPGNYSTALPERIDRRLSPQEELLSQSTKVDGGVNVYTGMNNDGDFYIGNKKVSSATGQEEVFDAPIPSVTGEDVGETGVSVGFDVLTPLEVTISRSIRVEGGPDGNIISEFDGPVIFNNKVTSTAPGGLEATSLYLQGNTTVSRNYTVGITQPVLAGNAGDVVFNANPSKGGFIGWVYTTDNDWYRWGNVSASSTESVGIFDRVGIATVSPGGCQLVIGSGRTESESGFNASGRSSVIVSCGGSLGIGTTRPEYDLHVVNNIFAAGFVTASYLYGDGSNITNLPTDSKWQGNETGVGANPGIHTGPDSFVGIGSTMPDALLSIQYSTTQTAKAFAIKSGFGTELIGINTLGRVGLGITNPRGILDVNGQFISNQFALSGVGTVNAGVITATTTLRAGVGGTVFHASGSSVGIGTIIPRATLDVDGSARFRTYSEAVATVSPVGNVVTIDLSRAQSFNVNITSIVNNFTIINPPNDASSFTLKITQDSTGGYSVGIDTFRNSGGGNIPVYWSGSVIPIVTTTANKIDIYSFITFDGGSSFYGVPGGQNFG